MKNKKLKKRQCIVIGEYEISDYNDDGFWIMHETGEGMRVNKKTLRDLIHKFYLKTF